MPCHDECHADRTHSEGGIGQLTSVGLIVLRQHSPDDVACPIALQAKYARILPPQGHGDERTARFRVAEVVQRRDDLVAGLFVVGRIHDSIWIPAFQVDPNVMHVVDRPSLAPIDGFAVCGRILNQGQEASLLQSRRDVAGLLGDRSSAAVIGYQQDEGVLTSPLNYRTNHAVYAGKAPREATLGGLLSSWCGLAQRIEISHIEVIQVVRKVSFDKTEIPQLVLHEILRCTRHPIVVVLHQLEEEIIVNPTELTSISARVLDEGTHLGDQFVS